MVKTVQPINKGVPNEITLHNGEKKAKTSKPSQKSIESSAKSYYGLRKPTNI